MLHDLHISRLTIGICVHRYVSAFLRLGLLAAAQELQSHAVTFMLC